MANLSMLDNHRRRRGDPRSSVFPRIIQFIDDLYFARQFDQTN